MKSVIYYNYLKDRKQLPYLILLSLFVFFAIKKIKINSFMIMAVFWSFLFSKKEAENNDIIYSAPITPNEYVIGKLIYSGIKILSLMIIYLIVEISIGNLENPINMIIAIVYFFYSSAIYLEVGKFEQALPELVVLCIILPSAVIIYYLGKLSILISLGLSIIGIGICYRLLLKAYETEDLR